MANPIGYTTAAEVERLRVGKTAVVQGEATAESVPVFLEEPARAYDAIGSGAKALQARVGIWTLECFGDEIACDMLERMDRFTEEALELVQSLGYTPDRAHALVDYVFGREAGEPSQEVGGTMTTLAALCNVAKIDIETAFLTEVERITTPAMVEKIRAKQAAKPTGSALPAATSTYTATGAGPVGEAVAWRWRNYGEGVVRPWTVRQSPVEPQEPRPGWLGIEVEALYARPAVEPGEVERLTRERDNAIAAAKMLTGSHARLRTALAETREHLEKVEAALRELEASFEAMASVRSQSTYLHIESDPGARDALTRLDNARKRALATLTGDAQEGGR